MYRQSLLVALLALLLTGCYSGPGYYESEVYTQPATVVGGGYVYETGYRPSYYAERRIYVAPQPRYYGQSRYYNQPRHYNQQRYYNQPRYYNQQRYYSPPPLPRHYQPGRPPGQAWSTPGRRDHERFGPRPGYRGDYRGGPSWRDNGHDRGGRDRGGWHRSGDFRRGDGRGGHR